MIKILKDGTKRKVKCNGCGAKLRFDESDHKINVLCTKKDTTSIKKWYLVYKITLFPN
jgi:hypothetical protein